MNKNTPSVSDRAKSVLRDMDGRGESSQALRRRGGKAIAGLALMTAVVVGAGKGDEVIEIVRGTPDRIDNNLDYHNNPPKEEQLGPDSNQPAPIEQPVHPPVTAQP